MDVVDNISTDDNYSDYQFYNSQSDDEEVCSSEPEITVGEPTPASLLNKAITSEKFKELNDNNKITTIDEYQDTVTAPTDLLEEIEKSKLSLVNSVKLKLKTDYFRFDAKKTN